MAIFLRLPHNFSAYGWVFVYVYISGRVCIDLHYINVPPVRDISYFMEWECKAEMFFGRTEL